MFGGKRYMTRGVAYDVPGEIVIFMWQKVDGLKLKSKGQMDYLQVFDLRRFKDINGDEYQLVIHRSEKPTYEQRYLVPTKDIYEGKVFVIDSIDYCTMLLAKEY